MENVTNNLILFDIEAWAAAMEEAWNDVEYNIDHINYEWWRTTHVIINTNANIITMDKSVVILALMRAQENGVLDIIRREYALAQAYADPKRHDELVQDIGEYVANERAEG